MRKILVICFCLVLMGGLIMPTQAHNISLQLNNENLTIIEDVNVYYGDKFIGKTNKTGYFSFNFKEKGEYKLTFKKGGFEEYNAIILADENSQGLTNIGFGVLLPTPTPTLEPTSEPTPEPTPEIFPTVPPLPEGHKSQQQKITELEEKLNTTIQEHETRITWLEGKIKAILDWVKDKFGDIL